MEADERLVDIRQEMKALEQGYKTVTDNLRLLLPTLISIVLKPEERTELLVKVELKKKLIKEWISYSRGAEKNVLKLIKQF